MEARLDNMVPVLGSLTFDINIVPIKAMTQKLPLSKSQKQQDAELNCFAHDICNLNVCGW